MELFELENIAKRENINLINCKMNKNKARIINYHSPFIFMDYSKIDSSTEEKCLLAEELRTLFLLWLFHPLLISNCH